MNRFKRILISGYYGFSNAGDEAVLSAIISGLKSHIDGIEVTVLSATPGETSDLHGVRALPRTSMSSVVRAIRGCDLLISGGGSLIQDATSFRSLVYYLWVIALAKLCRRKVMLLGQGIGPLRRGISRKLARSVLNGADVITVRDAPSADLLRELGVCNPPIQVTADPTFALSPCAGEESLHLLSEAGLDGNEDIIAVSLRKWPEAPKIERAMADALSALSERLPVKFLLVAMQVPDDMLFAERVCEMIGGRPGIVVQPRAWTAEQLLGVIGRCRLVVGMRLHALIFAAAAGVPSVGIAYDPKVEHFLAATGQESISLADAASGVLADRVTAVWERRDELTLELSRRVSIMKKAADENIRLAIELLNSGPMNRVLPMGSGKW